MTVNLWNDDWTPNGWSQRTHQQNQGRITTPSSSFPFTTRNDAEETFRLVGPNTSFNFGFLWDINDTWRVGGVYKTELLAAVEHRREIFRGAYSPTNPSFTSISRSNESFDETMHLPPAYGLGVAYMPSDKISLAFDLYRTEWDRYFLEAEDGHRYNLLTRAVNGESDVPATMQARLGMEYLIIRGRTVYPLRAGVFYDPEPAADAPQDVYGVSLGGGYVREPWLIDAAVQYRFGQGLKTVIVADQTSETDLSEGLVMLSVIYHFPGKKP
jgi:long-subunit fatty acid transport protein